LRPLFHLGDIASLEGDHAEARRLLAECALAADALGDPTQVAPCLESLARAVVGLGRARSAATILGAADALRERIAGPAQPVYVFRLERTTAAARAALGAAAFEAAWSRGRTLTPEQAVACALDGSDSVTDATAPARAPTPEVASPLTRREREVASLIARGASNRQIARELVIAERTAERHLENILAKLGLQSRTQVALWAVEHRIPTVADG
jgi:DNA-binding NarL/FixJ family response regulator